MFENLSYGQSPEVLFITQTQPGELFFIRNIGNMIPAFGVQSE
jgi:carbonic anhydrase